MQISICIWRELETHYNQENGIEHHRYDAMDFWFRVVSYWVLEQFSMPERTMTYQIYRYIIAKQQLVSSGVLCTQIFSLWMTTPVLTGQTIIDDCLEVEDITCLKWPASSFDLKLDENAWGPFGDGCQLPPRSVLEFGVLLI